MYCYAYILKGVLHTWHSDSRNRWFIRALPICAILWSLPTPRAAEQATADPPVALTALRRVRLYTCSLRAQTTARVALTTNSESHVCDGQLWAHHEEGWQKTKQEERRWLDDRPTSQGGQGRRAGVDAAATQAAQAFKTTCSVSSTSR